MKIVENTQVLIDRSRLSKEQKKDNYKNKKAMTILLASMSRDKAGKVQHCILAKEIQEILENHYEGNVQVRSKKFQLHVYKSELFKMKPKEFITKIINKLNAFLTTLRKLGKHYSKDEVNTKILKVLSKKDWELKVTSIEEAYNLSKPFIKFSMESY